MKKFNVIYWDYNRQKMSEYDIIPYLMSRYKEKFDDVQPFGVVKNFIEKESLYQWWARCEYEIILTDWPGQQHSEKWDIYRQVLMNLDIITQLFIDEIAENI